MIDVLVWWLVRRGLDFLRGKPYSVAQNLTIHGGIDCFYKHARFTDLIIDGNAPTARINLFQQGDK